MAQVTGVWRIKLPSEDSYNMPSRQIKRGWWN